MRMTRQNILTIVPHGVFIVSLVIVGLFFDPRPDFVKQGGSLINQQFFLLMIVFMLSCFYINMFYLVPKILTQKGWAVYLLVLLVVILSTGFSSVYLISTQGSKFFIAPPVLFILLIITFSVSTSIRLNSDRVKNEKRRKEQENESLRSELSLLRAQISPHFMFNVLNTLASLARQKSDDLENVIIEVSQMMRYMLYGNSENKISLSDEINYLNSYIQIQKLRFEHIHVNKDWDNIDPNLKIEPMLFIPLLENAFKHGTAAVDKPQIDIQITTTEKHLTFMVSNRFNPQMAHDQPKGIGLENVTKRLTYLYENKQSLECSTTKNRFIAQLKIVL